MKARDRRAPFVYIVQRQGSADILAIGWSGTGRHGAVLWPSWVGVRVRFDMLRWITAVRESLASPAKAERRGEQRIPYKTTIEIRTADGITYRGYSRDLSLRGMGALVAASLEIGDEIWVKYDHPKRGEQISRATVRQAKVRSRLSSSRYGFEFRLPLDI